MGCPAKSCGWWTCDVLPMLGLNRSLRKRKQYEQTEAHSAVNNVTCAYQRVADPHPSDHDLEKEYCHVSTAVYQPATSFPKGVDISYKEDKIQQVRRSHKLPA